MQDLYNFICAHYEAIISFVLIIISVVVFILRKKPVDSILSSIFISAVQAVVVAETTDLKGLEKLNYAVGLVEANLKQNYPDLKVRSYYGFIVKVIEDILSTPQKKGDK